MSLTNYIRMSNIDPSLIKAVVKGLGGWKEFLESYQDVCNNGASAGFGDFIYYSDTCAFALKYRSEIKDLLNEIRESIGEHDNIISFVQSFNCLGKETNQDDIAQALYGTKSQNKDNTQVLNALAWFALEEVCRDYDNTVNS